MKKITDINYYTDEEAINYLAGHSYNLEHPASLNPLMDKIGDARLVLLGEASHGTHEYYIWRTHITKRLIEEKGFSFVAVEGDWPDCYRLNRYIKNYADSGASAAGVLKAFNRWPTWMWANWETVALAEWMRNFNAHRLVENKVGFYGLDVYSLWESMEALVNYLKTEDPETLHYAEQVLECFEPYAHDEGYSYGREHYSLPGRCEEKAVQLLTEIRGNLYNYDGDYEAALNAEKNASVIVDAEKYYRTMMKTGPASWNIRDTHMVDTLNNLLEFYGPEAKAVVWEHNTHIGDARATDMRNEGMVNVGQLVSEQHDKEGVFRVGFGSYRGTVIAGKSWGAPMEVVNVPPAPEKSWEHLLHSTGGSDKLVLSSNLKNHEYFSQYIDHRAIGVVYRPQFERLGNYVPSIIPQRYEAFIYIDETTALHPLHIRPDGHQTPETYPWGV